MYQDYWSLVSTQKSVFQSFSEFIVRDIPLNTRLQALASALATFVNILNLLRPLNF